MEIDYFDALGVETPQEEPGPQETEVQTEDAAPDTGEQEPGEETENGGTEQETAAQEEPAGEDSSAEGLYHRAEREARQHTLQEMDALLASAGIVDPYTQKPISTREELIAYRDRYQQDKRREFQESHGMSEQAYQAYVSELPEVKAARAEAQRAAADGARARLEQDLREVEKLDPTVKGLEDLAKGPKYANLCGLVEKGLSLPDAYKLAYFDELSQRKAEATRQAALNSVNGKAHLERTPQRGEGAAPVPADVAAEYRMFLPGATDAEIQNHYSQYEKARRA